MLVFVGGVELLLEVFVDWVDLGLEVVFEELVVGMVVFGDGLGDLCGVFMFVWILGFVLIGLL